MNISELLLLLTQVQQEHGDIPVVETRYSDYQDMALYNWEVVEGVRMPEWVRRVHPTDPSATEKYLLLFHGN